MSSTPLIEATSRDGAAAGLGYAQMREHAELFLTLVAEARGRQTR